MEISNTFARLPERFFARVEPVPVSAPRLLLWNAPLAETLGIEAELGDDPERLAAFFSGNERLPGSEPLALAYAGHQFGGFVPQLGDGRAHLLGELVDGDRRRYDLQLKGSGPTPFSRGGDGRCALGPALREYIMSEAMHALGVPTTRCLAVVVTGEPVFRNGPLPGAVVTRVASSHLRVGTFEYFAARKDAEAIRLLADHAIDRHYPDLADAGPDRYLALLQAVSDAQIRLVTEWMRVGFIHGVMNTDNTSISGETIDYGPCAMLGIYDPATVFSSIDRRGRYAYGNQPAIVAWNLTRFAETLVPLIDDDRDRAIARLQTSIATVPERLETAWADMMARKLGFSQSGPPEQMLIAQLLERARQKELDYTILFDRLTRALDDARQPEALADDLGADWVASWRAQLDAQGRPPAELRTAMRTQNPVVIPRNHHVEALLQETSEHLDTTAVEAFLTVLRAPYETLADTPRYQDPPADGDDGYVTFCGT